jgi:hypothetical protein
MITGCSNPFRGYDTPEDICDIGLPADTYKPFLPRDTKITTNHQEFNDGMKCSIYAEGSLKLRVAADLYVDGISIDHSIPYWVDTESEPREVEGNHEILAWPGYTRAKVACASRGAQDTLLIVVDFSSSPDSEGSEEDLAELTQLLAEALSSHCPDGLSARAG